MVEDKKTIIVDVRTPAEHSALRIPGSINIPLSELHTLLNIEGIDQSRIELYCQTGNRSEMAKNALVSSGYDAVNIGGIIHNIHRL